MKVALVHDWLIHMRGGEKVLESIAELYPDAVIYTLFYRREALSPALAKMKIKASFLQWFPGITRIYRGLLPLLPLVIATLKFDDRPDLVISSSHCVAKGIRIPRGAVHVCYCHTPMRYAWGFEKEYFGKFPTWFQPLIRLILGWLRSWDHASSRHVGHFIANSKNVQEKIRKYYGRESSVLCPPLDKEFFRPAGSRRDYFLVVSAFVPYKRVDLVIETFNGMDRELRIVGSGPLGNTYRKLAKGQNISFLGSASPERLRELYAGARALIFPTDEDFGIVPLEAQACGTPVIALARGGALESVQYGVFFHAQSVTALRDAIEKFETMTWDHDRIAQSVANFDKNIFQSEIKKAISSSLIQDARHVAC